MKIALIELSSSHEECLYSQIKILKSDASNEVHLIVNESLQKSVSYHDLLDKFTAVKFRSGFKRVFDLLILWKLIQKESYDKVILNTAQSNNIRDFFIMPYSSKIDFIGVLHNIKKLENSFSQKIISLRVKKYFVLSDEFKEQVLKLNKRHLKVESFYPIYFPNISTNLEVKIMDDLWITIPGSVEFNRRDYQLIFESLQKTKLNRNIKILFLGRLKKTSSEYEYISKKIQELKLENNIILFDRFIENDEFYSYIENSDFLLPLIHLNPDKNSAYKYKITGTFNLAIGFKKPMLLHECFKNHDDFINNAIFYNDDNLISMLNKVSPNEIEHAFIDKKWNFETQMNKYIKFIVG